jgi:hypothetical protein
LTGHRPVATGFKLQKKAPAKNLAGASKFLPTKTLPLMALLLS